MAILLTGCAGFIGFHTARSLLARGERVIGVDNLNDYYDVALKKDRLALLHKEAAFTFCHVDIANPADVGAALGTVRPTAIIHLAAQAGVRYSIENPSAYVASNLQGHSTMLELARLYQVDNMVYASSSSVYGGNTKTPFTETHRTDDPVSFYGATKKSNELLSNAYARLYGIPMTGLRFFTVYGPWGRPDMAYWIFSHKILQGAPIRIFNQGKMSRDFTYIDDIVAGVIAALDTPATKLNLEVPHRIYNMGNDASEELMTLVELLEQALGRTAEKIFEPMQKGDVEHTWADISRAQRELGYTPKTPLDVGVTAFTRWFKSRYTS